MRIRQTEHVAQQLPPELEYLRRCQYAASGIGNGGSNDSRISDSGARRFTVLIFVVTSCCGLIDVPNECNPFDNRQPPVRNTRMNICGNLESRDRRDPRTGSLSISKR